MTLIKSISGIRGTIGGATGDTLNPLDIVKFTTAYATFIPRKTGKIVVGRDGRISGPMVRDVVCGTLSHEHQIEYALSDLIDMIDSTYCVSTCSIAGLSDGARMAANIANLRPDRISDVGLFSPVLHKDQLPRDSTQSYSIYVGKNDFF